jgi:hypothetical protein
MWWQYLLSVMVGLTVGAGIYTWGWNQGFRYGREEGAYERYVDAMKDEG